MGILQQEKGDCFLMRGLVFPKVVMNVLSRVVFLYLAIIAGFLLWTDYKTVVRSAQLQTLSRLTPSFDYYQEFFRDPSQSDPRSLRECLYYHKTVADLVPAAAGEAWGVAGFCAYELGRKKEAVSLLEKSIVQNPVFFWDHYNLGVMAFNQGDYERAGKAFSRAVQLDPKYTVFLLARSKVYADIRRSFQDGYDPQKSLASGYERAMGFLKASISCHADSQDSACHKRPRLHPQIF